jgi:hypothetical protein
MSERTKSYAEYTNDTQAEFQDIAEPGSKDGLRIQTVGSEQVNEVG